MTPMSYTHDNGAFCRVSYKIFALYGHLSIWPLPLRVLTTVVAGTVLLLGTVLQIGKVVEDGPSIELLLDVMPPTMCTSVCFAIVIVGVINRKRHETLNDLFDDDSGEVWSAGESRLRSNCFREARLYVTYYTLLTFVIGLAIFLCSFKSQILDVLRPLNASRPRELLLSMYFPVDQKRHFYAFFVLQNGAILGGYLVGITLQNVFIMVVCGTCGRFVLTGHRIENLTLIDEILGEKVDYEDLVLCRIMTCIRGHHMALEFAKSAHAACNLYLFLSLFATVVGLTFSLAAITNPQARTAKLIMLTNALFWQYFLISLLGQKLMDASTQLSNNTCHSAYYDLPLVVQKCLVLMILRSHRPTTIVMGSLFVLSVENFCAIVKTALSYCMVIRQFQ